LVKILVSIVLIEHLFFLWMEMFAWTSFGKRAFKGAMPPEMFEATKGMAANQGLYNGFLAAGLAWSLLIGEGAWAEHVATFFLGCVLLAGLYGGYSVSKKILWIQALPAAIALVLLHAL
ncbi:MAG: DUF1304 domain-containing protein, partial [Flavobacteriales bacterium]|nr:DUF1304 domain-containing protein [Flavobacteriales bacterium]